MGDGIRFYSAGGWSIVAIILLICLVVLLIPLLFLGLVGAAFARLGFSWIAAVAAILLMILGRAVNIPLWKIQRDMVRLDHNDESGRNGYEPWETVISLNLGGAVIPVVIAVYLLVISTGSTGMSIGVPVIVGVILVAALSYIVTRRVQGAGLRVPLFMPGLTALLCGFVLAGGVGLEAGVTAFVSGTFGTLLGANVANLHRIRDLGVDGFSIGGAGTFGAVFISCILSALIA
ncbi:MAG: DUF1614 domain-containing protein [Methanoregula sp.]